jgi:hypothetical protein
VTEVTTTGQLYDATRLPEGTEVLLDGIFDLEAKLRPKAGMSFVPAPGAPRPFLDGHGTCDFGIDAKGGDRGRAVAIRVEGLEIANFTKRGVVPWIAAVVRENLIHDCGMNGIGGGFENLGAQALIERNEVHHCGSEAELGSDAGGMKFAGTGIPGRARSGVTVRDNWVHDCLGVAIWLDVNCAGDVIARNRLEGYADLAEGTSRKGIHYEISAGPARIARNKISGFRTEPDRPHSTDAGISITSSKGVYVFANELTRNGGRAIHIRQDDRPTWTPPRGYALEGIVVEQNDPGGEEIRGCDLAGVDCHGNP